MEITRDEAWLLCRALITELDNSRQIPSESVQQRITAKLLPRIMECLEFCLSEGEVGVGQDEWPLSFVLGMLENLKEGSHQFVACTRPFEITKRFLERKEYVGKKTAGGTSPKSANTLATLLRKSVETAKKQR